MVTKGKNTVNSIVKFFTLTTRQTDSLLKWSGTAVTLAGAVLTSLAIDPVNVYLFNAGSLLFLIWAVRIQDNALIAVNAGLLTIYAVGTVRALVS
jgi:hypothetical protein